MGLVEPDPEIPTVLEQDVEDTIVNIDSDDAFLKTPEAPSASSSKASKRNVLHSIATDEGMQHIFTKRSSSMTATDPEVQQAPSPTHLNLERLLIVPQKLMLTWTHMMILGMSPLREILCLLFQSVLASLKLFNWNPATVMKKYKSTSRPASPKLPKCPLAQAQQ